MSHLNVLKHIRFVIYSIVIHHMRQQSQMPSSNALLSTPAFLHYYTHSVMHHFRAIYIRNSNTQNAEKSENFKKRRSSFLHWSSRYRWSNCKIGFAKKFTWKWSCSQISDNCSLFTKRVHLSPHFDVQGKKKMRDEKLECVFVCCVRERDRKSDLGDEQFNGEKWEHEQSLLDSWFCYCGDHLRSCGPTV